MKENIDTLSAEDSSSADKKDRAPKGAALPFLSVDQYRTIMKDLGSRGLTSGTRDRLSAILGNKPSSSIYVNKVIALRLFGLITTEGDSFYLTDLGKRLAYAKTPKAELQATQEAFRNHPLLSRSLSYYAGKYLEPERVSEALANQGIVPERLKNEWAKYFLKAIRQASLIIQENGRELVADGYTEPPQDEPDPVEEEKQVAAVDAAPIDQPSSRTNQQNDGDDFEAFIRSFKGNVVRRTISNDRQFVMIIPEELSEGDVSKIRRILKSTEDGLEGYLAG